MNIHLPPTTSSLRAAYWHKDGGSDGEGSWFVNKSGVVFAVVDDVYFAVDASQMLALALAELPPGDYTHAEIAAVISRNTFIRLARVGPELVICERAGDRTRSRPHRFTAYQVDAGEPGEPFWMAPENTLFVLHETHFASPPDWRLQLCADPHGCYNWVVAAIHEALEPVERVSFGSIMCGDSAERRERQLDERVEDAATDATAEAAD